MHHRPGGLIGHREQTFEAHRADSVLLSNHEEHRPEPLTQRGRCTVRDSPGCQRCLVATIRVEAFPKVRCAMNGVPGTPAAGADEPVGPAQMEEVFGTDLFCGELLLESQ